MARATIDELERRLKNLKARRDYYTNRNITGEDFNANVRENPKQKVGYRSLFLMDGADREQFKIKATTASLSFYADGTPTGDVASGLTALGLDDLTTAPESWDEPPKNFKYSKVQLVKGATNPTGDRTPWGTRYVRYTAKGDGTTRVSFTAPICKATTAFTVDDLKAATVAIATARATQLGVYGSIRLQAEHFVDTFKAP